MFSWLKNNPEENTKKAFDSLKDSDDEWQDNLESKGIKGRERAIEMNKNYKALTNYKAQELRDITNTPKESSVRLHFNNEALTETKDLLDNQTEATIPVENKEDVINILEEERSKKRGWFW